MSWMQADTICHRWCDVGYDSLHSTHWILVDIGSLFIVPSWKGKAYQGHILPSTDERLIHMILLMIILQIEWIGLMSIGTSFYKLHGITLINNTWLELIYSRDFFLFFFCGSRCWRTGSSISLLFQSVTIHKGTIRSTTVETSCIFKSLLSFPWYFRLDVYSGDIKF